MYGYDCRYSYQDDRSPLMCKNKKRKATVGYPYWCECANCTFAKKKRWKFWKKQS